MNKTECKLPFERTVLHQRAEKKKAKKKKDLEELQAMNQDTFSCFIYIKQSSRLERLWGLFLY